MKHNKVILAACSLLLLFSCATTRQASGVKVSKIREFAYIKPCAYMVFYEDDGAGYYNQTNSDLAINAAAQAAESVKDQAETDFTVHVVFKEGNVMGAPEKEAVILKSFNFKPVN